MNIRFVQEASAYQPGCFFADRRSAILGSTRIDDAGCSRVGSKLSFLAMDGLIHLRHRIGAVVSSRHAVKKT